MKLQALLLLVLATVLPLAAPHTAHARADVSFDYFYDALLPYGEWIEVAGHGFCWRPTDVDADWAPYADGYWAFTDAGWTWVGYEEFAGIVYHYGRWLSVEGEGWCWVPDYEWGPGWVSWRKSDDYIGWAPLSPRARWQPEIGISVWVDTVSDIGPAFYSFCRVRDFGAPVLRPVIINRGRNVTIIRNTVNITNITYNTYGDSPVIYNGGPSYTFISSRSERPVPTLKLVRTTQFERADFRRGPGGFSPNARTVGNQLMVNAPVVAPPEQPAFLQDKVKKTFAADKVRDGWAGVKDAKVRDDLRQHFRRETKGLTPSTAPAKAVVAADLKVVPAQADPNAAPPVLTGRGPRGQGDRQPPATPAPPVAEATQPPKDSVPPATPPGAVATQPATTPDPRAAGRLEREKGRGKSGDATVPPAVTGAPLKPFNPSAAATPPPATPPGADPRAAEKTARETDRPKQRGEQVPAPVVIAPPVTGQTPAPVVGTVEPRLGRGPKPAKDGLAADPAAAAAAKAAREPANIQQPKADSEKLRVAEAEAEKARHEQERMARQRDAEAATRDKQAAEQAATAARERANIQKQTTDLEKLRAKQAEAGKARGAQERTAREHEADANAAALRQKQAAEAAAAAAEKAKLQAQEQQRATQMEREKLQANQEGLARQRAAAEAAAAAQKKQLEAQRDAEAGRKAEMQRQQADAQAKERQRAQQEQIAGQQRKSQIEQQRAAQETARQQAAGHAREQQAEQQQAAQESAKQQAGEQRRQQQAEQQKAAQEAGRQQAEQQRRAADAQREQAARQQAEAQRGAQQPPAQPAPQPPAQDPRRGDKEKDKDKDKGR